MQVRETFRRRSVIAAAAIAFALAVLASVLLLSRALPASEGPREDPAAFLTRMVGLVVDDGYARAWASLYPAHQQVAPRDEYVACELKTPVGWQLRSVDVIRSAERLRRIPGEPERVPVTSVTLRLQIADPALHTQEAFTHAFSAVAVGDHWTWILTPSKYRLYRSNGC